MAKQLGMAIDLNRCIGCHACTVACKVQNGLAIGMNWHRVETIGAPGAKVGEDIPRGVFPDVSMRWLPMPCMHCVNPPCMGVCPTAAISKTAEGLVVVDKALCVGCKYCSWACPYNVPQFSAQDGTMEKCTFCIQRVAQGQEPACVKACVYGARVFGDVNDAHSTISQVIARKHGRVLLPEEGTKPAVYYIGI